MKIDGLSHPQNLHKALKKQDQVEAETDITKNQTVEQEIENQPEEELKGVLKLLSEGHFKGVADLRLRINHADKLDGIELAEPVPPSNNGKAYEKFLEIYNQLNSSETQDEPIGENQDGDVLEVPIEETADQNSPEQPPIEQEQPVEIDLTVEPLIDPLIEEPENNLITFPEIINEQQQEPLDLLA